MYRILIFTILGILFVSNSMSFANSDWAIITPQNADQTTLLNTFGRGRLQDVLWSSQGTIAVETNIGIWIYEDIEDIDPYFIPDAQAMTFSGDGEWLVTFTIRAISQPQSSQVGYITIYNTITWEVIRVIEYIPDNHWIAPYTRVYLVSDKQALFATGYIPRRYDLSSSSDAYTTIDTRVVYVEVSNLSDNDTLQAYTILSETNSGTSFVNLGTDMHITGMPDSGNSGIVTGTFSPDSAQVLLSTCETYCGTGELILWNLSDNQEFARRLFETSYGAASIRTTEYSPDGRLIAVVDNRMRLWLLDANTLAIIGNLPVIDLPDVSSSSSYELEIAFSPDSKQIITVSNTERVLIWDIESATIVRELSSDEYGYISEILVYPSHETRIGLLFSREYNEVGWQGSVQILDTGIFEIAGLIPISRDSIVFDIGQHSPIDVIYTSTFGRAHVGDSQTGEIVREYETPGAMTMSTLSTDGRVFVIADCYDNPDEMGIACSGEVDVWSAIVVDGNTFEETLNIDLPFSAQEMIFGMILSDDGQYLLIHTDSSLVTIWNTTTGILVNSYEDECSMERYIDNNVHFISNNRVIFTRLCEMSEVVILDFESGLHTIFMSALPVRSLDISPDETLLAVQTVDDMLHLVDIMQLRTLTTIDVSAQQVHFSSDGTRLFALGDQLYTFGIEDN